MTKNAFKGSFTLERSKQWRSLGR